MKTLKVGLTGGIGSGKSTVTQIFSTLGVPIYIADTEAKRLIHEDEELRKAIINLIGSEAYDKNNKLRTAFIADRAFKNPLLLDELNKIVHPAVRKDFQYWINEQIASYAIEEAAILIESGAYKFMDKILLVTAPEELRIKRVVNRDDSTYEDVKARMDNQITTEERMKYADYVIYNEGRQALIPQVMKVDEELKKVKPR